MSCNAPLTMYWTGGYTAAGKKEYTFNSSKGYSDMSIQVPCGQCMGCRLSKSLDTATRAVHEASLYSHNCFITLTVDPEHIDEVFLGGGLSHRPWQLFLKKLRKSYCGLDVIPRPDWYKRGEWNNRPIRVLMCGEYGSLLQRPHYHACLFNFDFLDKYLWETRRGVKLFRSNTLERLWPYGYSTIGEVNFESAAYLARYVTKKITGDMADEHYFNSDTGEFMQPEYIRFPQGYGLGRLWFDKYSSDCYPSDFLISGKKKIKVRVPQYYDKIYDLTNPEELANLKKARQRRAVERSKIITPDILKNREYIQNARLQRYERDYLHV